jgi:plasmid stabilization system protein ParE
MGKFQFTPQAVTDLFDIWKFIANGSPEAADQGKKQFFSLASC